MEWVIQWYHRAEKCSENQQDRLVDSCYSLETSTSHFLLLTTWCERRGMEDFIVHKHRDYSSIAQYQGY